ncbi:MAG: hypothetical protein V1672_00345 [Candidatus Diapherotrites archaeon]
MSNKKKKTKENNDSISEEIKETELREASEDISEVYQKKSEDDASKENKATETDETQVAEKETTEIPKSRISQKTIMALGVVVIFAVVGIIFFFSIELPPTGQIVMTGLDNVDAGEITTFSAYEMDTCTDNGKPTVIQFSISTCPHCVWAEDAFKAAVKPYVAEGKISAYLWNLDTGDNLLTEIIETKDEIPRKHLQIFSHFDTQQQVPFFVIGCRYYRLGTAYEIENNKEKEVAEMKAVIEQMLKEFEEGK